MAKSFNAIIYPYSKISRLPKYLQQIALLIRYLISRAPRYNFEADCMATSNNFGFKLTPRFQFAEKKAIEASGFDYGIPLRIHQAIWCADHAIKLDPSASFVELGTGRGYVMSAILGSLEFLEQITTAPKVFLFDTFESTSTDLKSSQKVNLGRNIYYAESFSQVQETFSKYPNVTLVKGELPKSLDSKAVTLGRISFLHIDLNAPEIEIDCLIRLWNQILPGGIILMDDYACGGFEYSYELFNKIAKELNIRILTTASGQGIAIK
jgi:O-methyltransferase